MASSPHRCVGHYGTSLGFRPERVPLSLSLLDVRTYLRWWLSFDNTKHLLLSVGQALVWKFSLSSQRVVFTVAGISRSATPSIKPIVLSAPSSEEARSSRHWSVILSYTFCVGHKVSPDSCVLD